MTVENINGANIVRALEVANALREEFGEKRIDDLPAGGSGADQCVLAQAFNFNCMVSRDWDHRDEWYVLLKEKDQALKLSELLGGARLETLAGHSHKVYLPADIGRIAVLFDAGGLPDRYYEGDRPF